MGLEPLRTFWWIPCLLVLGYSITGKGNRATATAATGMAVPRVRSPESRLADAKEFIRSTNKTATPIALPVGPVAGARTKSGAADDVIPLLLDWQGKRSARSTDTGIKRTLFTAESDPVAAWAAQQRAEAQRRTDSWQGQGVMLAQASLRQAGSFACELRYGGECPPPPPPPPVAPRFAYELVGVFSQHAIRQAAFIDPATRTIVMARQGEKIGDTPFRVRKFNLTSVEVGADGFTENEKIPISKKSDDPPGSINP